MSRKFPANPRKTYGSWMLPLVGLAIGALSLPAQATMPRLLVIPQSRKPFWPKPTKKMANRRRMVTKKMATRSPR